MQHLALGGALVPKRQNIKLKLFNNRTKPCWEILLDCRAREDHIPSSEVPMDQLEHHSGDSHVSPEVVARVPAVAVRVWRWPRKCPTPPPRGLIEFQSYLYVDKKVHGGPWIRPWSQWVPIEGPKPGGCHQPYIGPELISRADKGKYPTGQTTECPEETLMSILLSAFKELTCWRIKDGLTSSERPCAVNLGKVILRKSQQSTD